MELLDVAPVSDERPISLISTEGIAERKACQSGILSALLTSFNACPLEIAKPAFAKHTLQTRPSTLLDDELRVGVAKLQAVCGATAESAKPDVLQAELDFLQGRTCPLKPFLKGPLGAHALEAGEALHAEILAFEECDGKLAETGMPTSFTDGELQSSVAAFFSGDASGKIALPRLTKRRQLAASLKALRGIAGERFLTARASALQEIDDERNSQFRRLAMVVALTVAKTMKPLLDEIRTSTDIIVEQGYGRLTEWPTQALARLTSCITPDGDMLNAPIFGTDVGEVMEMITRWRFLRDAVVQLFGILQAHKGSGV